MALLVEIHPAECQQCIIPTRAQFELRDTKNALRGLYCEKHGRRAMDKLHAEENPTHEAPIGSTEVGQNAAKNGSQRVLYAGPNPAENGSQRIPYRGPSVAVEPGANDAA